MELLARFELATVSRRAYARREPSDLAIEKADEAASYAEVTKNLRIVLIRRKFGAASQIRTGDLILTKDALYRLSYNSKQLAYYSTTWGFVNSFLKIHLVFVEGLRNTSFWIILILLLLK